MQGLNIFMMILVLIQIGSAIYMKYYPKNISASLRFKHAMSRLGWSANLVLIMSPYINLQILSLILFIPLIIYGTHTDKLVSRAQAKQAIPQQDQSIFQGKRKIQATPNSYYSSVYTIIHNQCKRAKVQTPKIYIKLDRYVNGATDLRHKPYKIILTTGAVDAIHPELFKALTAHEVGHLKQADLHKPFFIKHNVLAILMCVLISFGIVTTYTWLPSIFLRALDLLFWVMLYVLILIAPVLLYDRRREYGADDESVKITSLQNVISLLHQEETAYPMLKHFDTIIHPSNTERIQNIKHYAKKHHLN